MERISANSKRSRFKERLAQRIVSGEFSFGSRFPGLYELCDEYGISYVTVCKAVKMLADEGYLRCHPGVGYFVCYADADSAVRKEVSLISTSGFFAGHRADFESGIRLFERNGWTVNVLLGNDLYEFTEKINSPHGYAIITAFNVDWTRFSATFSHVVRRTVVLGRLSGNPLVTSVVCDEHETIRQCMDHFAAQGRKKIALICSLPQSELEALRIAAWRNRILASGLSMDWMRRHLLSLDLENQPDSGDRAVSLFRSWIREKLSDAEGIILPVYFRQFRKVCDELKVDLVDRLPVVTIGAPGFRRQGVHFLDNNFECHFHYAHSILEDRFKSGCVVPGAWYLCPPRGVRPSRETGEPGGTEKRSTKKTHLRKGEKS